MLSIRYLVFFHNSSCTLQCGFTFGRILSNHHVEYPRLGDPSPALRASSGSRRFVAILPVASRFTCSGTSLLLSRSISPLRVKYSTSISSRRHGDVTCSKGSMDPALTAIFIRGIWQSLQVFRVDHH